MKCGVMWDGVEWDAVTHDVLAYHRAAARSGVSARRWRRSWQRGSPSKTRSSAAPPNLPKSPIRLHHQHLLPNITQLPRPTPILLHPTPCYPRRVDGHAPHDIGRSLTVDGFSRLSREWARASKLLGTTAFQTSYQPTRPSTITAQLHPDSSGFQSHRTPPHHTTPHHHPTPPNNIPHHPIPPHPTPSHLTFTPSYPSPVHPIPSLSFLCRPTHPNSLNLY